MPAMPQPPLPPPQLVTTPDQLSQTVAELRAAGRFALDTESNSLFAYFYQVCLIQVSTAAADYLIDPQALPDLSPLQALVAEPGMEVTMHAAENDILLLHRDFGFIFSQIFDTLWAARILGWEKPGLASILNERFDVQTNKRMQRTDWGQRPLSPEQLHYARLDTHYLSALRDMLEQELRDRNRWEEAKEVFGGLINIRWQAREQSTFWRLPGIRDLSPGERAVLHALYEWREAKAQRRNIPPFRVLRNETLLALAQQQPLTEQKLRSIKGVPKRLPNHVIRKLLKVIRQGQSAPPPQKPRRNNNWHQRPDSAELDRYDRLRNWRTQKARERGVEPDVVLTNQVIKSIARACPLDMAALEAEQLLTPWKQRSYGPDIIKLCRRSVDGNAAEG